MKKLLALLVISAVSCTCLLYAASGVDLYSVWVSYAPKKAVIKAMAESVYDEILKGNEELTKIYFGRVENEMKQIVHVNYAESLLVTDLLLEKFNNQIKLGEKFDPKVNALIARLKTLQKNLQSYPRIHADKYRQVDQECEVHTRKMLDEISSGRNSSLESYCGVLREKMKNEQLKGFALYKAMRTIQPLNAFLHDELRKNPANAEYIRKQKQKTSEMYNELYKYHEEKFWLRLVPVYD